MTLLEKDTYRVFRLDLWDYRTPTEHVFESLIAAQKKADELQKLSDRTIRDPTVSYIACKEQS